MDGVEATTIEVDSHAFRVYVGTNEGFHFLDLQTGLWTERDDVGQTDRKVSLIKRSDGLANEILLGRVNSSNQGYLELTDSLGTDFTVVYQSEGGPFIDMEYLPYEQKIFVCSSADVNPGEFLKSTDGGTSWLPVFGHGHTSLTCLAQDTSHGTLYVVGDNGISLTMDGGISWEPFVSNLPAGEMLTSFEFFDVGDCAIETVALACTQDSVYIGFIETPSLFHFQPVLADSFLKTVHGFAAITDDGRVMRSRSGGFTWDDWTGDLSGQPIDFEFSMIESSLFVCTQSHGIFQRQHVVSAVGQDYPNQPQVSLKAWPNPFNPRVNLSFEMASAGPVELEVFDTRGRKVATIHKGWMDAGSHQLSWDARGAASGVYLAQITTSEEKQTTRLVLVR